MAVGVLVGVDVSVGVEVMVGVGLRVGVHEGVSVGVQVGVGLRVGVGVREGAAVDVAVAVCVAVAVGVHVGNSPRSRISNGRYVVDASSAPARAAPAGQASMRIIASVGIHDLQGFMCPTSAEHSSWVRGCVTLGRVAGCSTGLYTGCWSLPRRRAANAGLARQQAAPGRTRSSIDMLRSLAVPGLRRSTSRSPTYAAPERAHSEGTSTAKMGIPSKLLAPGDAI
jgi:hypothetical protein